MSPRPTSPPSRSSSRPSSVRTPGILQHAPITPSALREAHTLSGSPEDAQLLQSDAGEGPHAAPRHAEPSSSKQPKHPESNAGTDDGADHEHTRGSTAARRTVVGEMTSLLRKPFEIVKAPAHAGPCNHGTFSPRMESPESSILGFGGSPPANNDGEAAGGAGVFSSLLSKVGRNGNARKKMNTTNLLAERHGITNTTSMYVSEHSPLLVSRNWHPRFVY
jgi:hypothetical protein